jgi:rubrerythrin
MPSAPRRAEVSLPIDFSKLAAQDVLDIAAFIEREAQQRYEAFADHLERQGNTDAARFFRDMAILEGSHGQAVTNRREREFDGLPAHLRDVVDWDVEGPEMDHDVSKLSAADGTEMALASERRARDFYAEAIEHLADPAVTAVLADLHRDEIYHIRLLEERSARNPGTA